MTGEVIKEFLVGLGFGVDDASLAKFNKSIQSATLRVTGMYASIKLAAAGIFYGISKISEGFEQMGYELRIIQPAFNKILFMRRETFRAYAQAGVNLTKVVQEAVKYNIALERTKLAFKALYGSVASKFFPLLTKQMNLFRNNLYANMPKIQRALERFIKFVFKAFEATVQLGTRLFSVLGRVYDFFAKLHEATSGWSTVVVALIAAWKLLNLSFLASPLGMLLTGFLALLALYDDFKTFQEGGESLFNWDKAMPAINAAISAFTTLKNIMSSIIDVVSSLSKAIYNLFTGNFTDSFDKLKDAAGGVFDWFKSAAGMINAPIAAMAEAMNKNSAQVTAANEYAAELAGRGFNTAPLGTQGGSNTNVNQKVSQQTSIVVQGSADANSVGKNVASQQNKVNYDLTRNLKGATR